MEFPNSKDRLDNYCIHELSKYDTLERITDITGDICRNVEKVVTTTNNKHYNYRINKDNLYGSFVTFKNTVSLAKKDYVLNKLIHEIRMLFPESRVILDPTNTYILIDWS